MSGEIWRPSVTVAAIIEKDGRFLFVEEMIDGKRVLNQPAGHLDPGESLVAACAREAMEETAYAFRPKYLVGIYRWRYAPKDITYLRFAFCGEVGAADPARTLDKEIVALHWLTPAQLTERRAEHRSALVLKCVEDFLAGHRYPLEVLSTEFS
jgi:8-oxo-dGTP pyrophosphatase MutT (NUDIX family)